MNFFVSLFNMIRFFFSSMFFPSSPENQKRTKIKKMYDKLGALPFEFLTKDKKISPKFISVIYNLYIIILPVKYMLDQTIASKDMRVSSGFQDEIIEKALSAEQKKNKKTFNFQQREENFQKEINSNLEVIQNQLQQQTRAFHDFLRELNTNEIKEAELSIKKVFAFYDLCCFDFSSLFMKSNKKLDNNNPDKLKTIDPKDFSSVFVDDIMQELLDLNFLLQNLNIDDELLGAIQSIYKKVVGNSEDKFLFISKQLTDAADIIKKTLGKNTILYIIRIVKEEPDFRDTTPPSDFYPVNEYKERLEAHFEVGSKRLLGFYKEVKIKNSITEAFGTQKLFVFTGYNDSINNRLLNSTTLSFDWIRPMEIIRTFTKRFFEQHMKAFLRNLLVEGLFENKKTQQSFSAAYYYCDGLSQAFEAFEALFAQSSKYSLSSIEGFLKEIEDGGNFEHHLEKIILFLNFEAKKLVQESFIQYTNLFKNCTIVIEDSKKPVPEVVSNIRVLTTSVKMRNLFTEFDEIMVTFAKFLEIMKNYAIIDMNDNQDGWKR